MHPIPCFRAPWPRGLGYRVETILRTFLPSNYIPMPNFTQIGQTVWISIRYEHIYIYIYFVLYILDYYLLFIFIFIIVKQFCCKNLRAWVCTIRLFTAVINTIQGGQFCNCLSRRHDFRCNDIMHNGTQHNEIQHYYKWNATYRLTILSITTLSITTLRKMTLSTMALIIGCCYTDCHLCWVSFMLSVGNAEYHYAECHYVECRLCWVLVMPNVVTLSVIMLSVVAPFVTASKG